MHNETNGKDLARQLLQHSFKDHDMKQLIGRSRLNVFDEVSAEDLAKILENEDFDTQALILAHIDARKSFETLEVLSPNLSSQLVFKISKLEPVTEEFLDGLNEALKAKLG